MRDLKNNKEERMQFIEELRHYIYMGRRQQKHVAAMAGCRPEVISNILYGRCGISKTLQFRLEDLMKAASREVVKEEEPDNSDNKKKKKTKV